MCVSGARDDSVSGPVISGPDPALWPKGYAAAADLRPLSSAGNSVCVFVHGFQAYFYVEKPRSWGTEAIDELMRELNVSGRGEWGRVPHACIMYVPHGKGHESPLFFHQLGRPPD